MVPDCTCHAPGYCPSHGREVSPIGARIWRRGNPAHVEAYFGDPAGRMPARPSGPRSLPVVGGAGRAVCKHLGNPVVGADGAQATQVCGPCGGRVRLKVFECNHPAHGPTTTLGDKAGCGRCADYVPDPTPRELTMRASSLPVRMVVPSEKRPVWRGGVLQIMVTRACDLACTHCTQGSDLAGKPVVMTPDEFEAAVRSLDGYFGVVGVFGGNPCLSPHFAAYCEVLKAHVPWEQRGLWCNHPRGKGALCRTTFNPRHSNLNCHLSSEAHAEFARDWPESVPFLKGMDQDSTHGAPFVALRDVVPDEAERWRMIGDCDVNRFWSALVGVVPGRGLRAYFCELAYAQAALHAAADDAADWPDTGLAVEPGWWRRPLADFEAQVRLHCHACGIPLRRPGRLAVGGEASEFSATHAAIARPKDRARRIDMVESIGVVGRPGRPATQYLPGVTPGYAGT